MPARLRLGGSMTDPTGGGPQAASGDGRKVPPVPLLVDLSGRFPGFDGLVLQDWRWTVRIARITIPESWKTSRVPE